MINSDPVGKTVEIMAKLFIFTAKEIIDEIGDDRGRSVLKRAVREFAEYRAGKIKEEIKKAGKDVNFHTIEEYSDYPANTAWEGTTEIEGDTLTEVTTRCPFAEAFRELKMESIGRIYCDEIDIALNEAFFGEIDFERVKIFSDSNDSPCKMVVKIK